MAVPRALLLTDVVDATRRSALLGDTRAAELWAAHDQLARDLIAEHRGREIDKTEGFLLLFDRAADAVAYAVAYHRALCALDLSARAGLHVGPVLLRENSAADVALGAKPLEVEGVAKPTAARVMSIATGGQTLMTAAARAALGDGSFRDVSHGYWRLKGVAQPIELFEVGDEDAPFTPPPDGAKVYRVVWDAASEVWLPVRAVRHGLPAERGACAGRHDELVALAEWFDRGARVVLVRGPAGAGKTRLAVRYGWTWLGDWPGGVWTCSLAAGVDADASLAAALGATGSGLAALASRGRCLVLVDGLDEVFPEAFRRCLVAAPHACFLLTSRGGRVVEGIEPFDLGALTAADAVALFDARARAASREYVGEPAVVRRIVDQLGRLPGAIEAAAGRMRLLSPSALLERLDAGSGDVPARSVVPPRAARPAPTPPPSVRLSAPRRHALLITDVVDSTRLSETLGDSGMAELWARHDRVARDLLPRHRGREIDKTDGFLLLFDRAADAVAYVCAYHAALGPLGIAARAGLHVGRVILRETPERDVARGAKPLEVEGAAKVVAARVMALAEGGTTLLTADAREDLDADAARSVGHWRIRGLSDVVELFAADGGDAVPADSAAAYRVQCAGDLWLPVRPVRHNLPAERDAFVGRASDLAAIEGLLDDGARLVSVLGMGGSGKTRLVARYAWSRVGDWPGGVWFCDLAAAGSLAGIAYAVATALDVPLGKGDVVVQLGDAIAGRGRCLVLLDNFEQVAGFAAESLGVWLDRAAEASFVVTSRVVLGIPGEAAVSVPPLRLAEAAALFETRARRARPDLASDDTDLVAILDLVGLLEGLPLAIELAAARSDAIDPRSLVSRMREHLDELSNDGERTDPLRATLDWSWDLLDRHERSGLAQLSVFDGGLTLECAERAVVVEEGAVADLLQALVDKSLVRRVSDTRLGLFTSVRDYAAEKAAALDLRADAERRHGSVYATFGEPEARRALYVHGSGPRAAALELELDNLITACRRATARGDGDVAAHTALAVAEVLSRRGPYAAGVALLEEVLPVAPPVWKGLIEAQRASLLNLAGDSAQVLVAASAALDHGLPESERAYQLAALGYLYVARGRHEEGERLLREALALAAARGDGVGEGAAEVNLAILSFWRGDVAGARAHLDRSLELYREVGNRVGEGAVVGNLGVLHVEQGRLDEAARCYEAAIEINREVGNRRREASALGNLGRLHGDAGRSDDARRLLEAAVEAHREVGDRTSEAQVLRSLGSLHLHDGDLTHATALFEAAHERHVLAGERMWASVNLGLLGVVDLRSGNLTSAIERLQAVVEELEPRDALGHATFLAPLGEARVAAGDADGGRADLDRAAGFLRERGYKAHLAEALCARARALADAVALDEAASIAADLSRGPASPLGREIAAARAALAAP